MQFKAITVEVESYVEAGGSHRRFRWLLREPNDVACSPHSFATMREASEAGQIALVRARERGRARL
jgi:hypothetical protein